MLPEIPEGFKRKEVIYPQLDALAEKVGIFIEFWGFKKIHGKIWTLLFLSPVPLDATTLVKRLRVSKALVSFSIHDLLEYSVIEEVARGRGRTILYRAVPDVTTVILNVLRLREKKMIAQVNEAMATLQKAVVAPEAANWVSDIQTQKLKEMVDSADHSLSFVIDSGEEAKNLFHGLCPPTH